LRRPYWYVGRFAVIVSVLLACLVTAGEASAAQLIDRNASDVKIAVNTKGEMLLTYRTDGAVKHVLVWGAVNALPPAEGTAKAERLLYEGSNRSVAEKRRARGRGTESSEYREHPLRNNRR